MRARLAACALAAACLALFGAPASALASQTLSVVKFGAGAGTVSSEPAGIECGTTCNAAFPNASTVTLSAAPGAHTQAVKWSGCNSISEGKCLVTMGGPRTVSATFELNQLELKVAKAGAGTGTVSSSPAGIDCGATCHVSFGEGSTVTLTGTPGASTHAVKWSGCDSISAGKCLVTMSAAREVTATFNAEGPLLSVATAGTGSGTVSSSPAAISCGEACLAEFPKNAKVALTATPGLDTLPVQWSGACSGSGKCEVTMSEAKSVTATFNLEPGVAFNLVSVERRGTGAGTVTGSGLECGALCSAEYLPGTELALKATPAPGSIFAHWSGGGCAGSGPCTTTIKSSRTIKAIFTLSGQRALSVAKNGTGQGTVTAKAAGIECGSRCTAQVPAGKKVTLSARAAAGSAFAGFSGACSGTKACTVTMSEARQVTATFIGPPAAPAPACVVPGLRGKGLKKAMKALKHAHCKLGKVRKPKGKKGHKLGRLVVKSFSPAAGSTLPAGAKVNLKLEPARKGH